MIAPGGTVGILGGGQLGRMIALAARPLGYRVVVYAPAGDNPAEGPSDALVAAPWDDLDAVRRFAGRCDVVTYEWENVPVAVVEAVRASTPVAPGPEMLAHTQDRLAERRLLHGLGLPTAAGRPVFGTADLEAAIATLGTPGRLKGARGGYDGGGQVRIPDLGALERARAALSGQPAWLYERDVPFDHEVSVIVARGAERRPVCFPVFENEHREGILWRTRWPAAVSPVAARRVQELACALAEAVDLVGTLTVECFVLGDEVRVNELAPRVHNSGHLTMEACAVSQFEQHVRAITGLPLAEPIARGASVMQNLLGTTSGPARLLGAERALAVPDVHLHLYGKAEVRPRRKMGHLTAVGPDRAEAEARVDRAFAALRFG